MKERNTVKKRCAEFGIACRGCFWLAVVILIAGIVLLFYLWTCPESDFNISLTETAAGTVGIAGADAFGRGALFIEFGRDVLTMEAANAPKTTYLIGQFGRVLSTLPVVAVLWLLRKIFRNIERQETPFLRENSRAVFWIGIAVIIYSYIQSSILPIVAAAAGIGNLSFSIINIAAIASGLPFICLSYIFEYGCALQKEADETL